MSGAGSIPSYDADLFTDDALAEPYGHYRALRDLGPVVWLGAHGIYAVSRYEDVRDVLGDPEAICPGQDDDLNDLIPIDRLCFGSLPGSAR